MEISPNKPAEIEIDSASVFYGKERILENLSLSIKEQRVGFIGRNGSGKTTLLRILAGLQELNNGKVLIDGTSWSCTKYSSTFIISSSMINPNRIS